MQAILGYQPGLWAGLSRGDAHCDDEVFDSLSRYSHQLRQMALAGDGFCHSQGAKAQRAWGSKSRRAVRLNY
eukprot:4317497-Prorocentrum_lima.AAC.1